MISMTLILLLCYLIGSIPNSIIAGRLLGGIDIREHGSGNAGATNVYRVMGWKVAIGVLLLDMAKGFIATYYIARIGAGTVPVDYSLLQILAGLTAVFGHIWTIFAKFKGGKGVATAGGMLLGLAPVTVLICLAVFVIVVWISRYVSLGSISAAAALSAITLIRKFGLHHDVPAPLLYFTIFATVLILYTHRTNIKRLLNGTENKFRKSTH